MDAMGCRIGRCVCGRGDENSGVGCDQPEPNHWDTGTLSCAPMTSVATLANTELNSYLPILILVGMAATFGVLNVVASNLVGPSRTGKTKEKTYESGMEPIGSAHKRFNVRFYIIAMIFLVFDIEIIFLYPWAVTFPNIDQHSTESLVWLGRILFFVLTTVVAYIYGVRKGVFKFD